MGKTWTFHSAGEILFGPGAVQHVGQRAQKSQLRKVLIVTDPALIKAGILDRVQSPLAGLNIEVSIFDGGQPEPSLQLVETCSRQAREFQPDGIFGVGGGSNMDLAKVVALLYCHGGQARDYLGEDRVPGPILPLFSIPTTAGSGSEVTGSAVLTDTDNQIKVAMLSNFLRPNLALVDPELTVSCPAKVTADSGIDALTHAIEAYTATDHREISFAEGEYSLFPGRHPIGDCVAEAAIRLVGGHLVRAVKHPDDLSAREGMALAATLGGLAFSNVGVALVHAMEYPLGGVVHCSHGLGNGLLLPYIMRFNLPSRHKEFARIAQLLGADISALTNDQAAECAIAAVEQLRSEIGIPNRLSELGIHSEQIPSLAEKAHSIKRLLRINPQPATVEDIERIYQEAL